MMKTLIGLMLATMLAQSVDAKQHPIDIDFYGSRSEYEALYKQLLKQEYPFFSPGPYRSLEPLVKLGKRNLQWLDHLNSFRDDRLSLTSEEGQRGTPIESPNRYGPTTVLTQYDGISANIPPSLKDNLFKQGELADVLPVEDQTYLAWAIEINYMYQTTVRWLTLSRHLGYYEQRKEDDIRGYHFLKDIPDLDKILQQWDNSSVDFDSQLDAWLVNICQSGNMRYSRCQAQYNLAKKRHALTRYKSTHWMRAEEKYNDNFMLRARRSDVDWLSPTKVSVSFRTPETSTIKDFLADNIEDEWHWEQWQLKLVFKSSANINVKFLPNVVPQVDGLGGNRILMNSLDSLEEYNTRWTIRHEFGHVMGFPDCYVEFYDAIENLMVNYQIDTSNLMCSRRGKLKSIHLEELKRVYGVKNY